MSDLYVGRKEEEIKAVRMSYCRSGLGGWVGGWVYLNEVLNRSSFFGAFWMASVAHDGHQAVDCQDGTNEQGLLGGWVGGWVMGRERRTRRLE